MSPIVQGSGRIREAMAEQAARAAAGRKWLTLREDGEAALIRFLSDIDDPRAPGGQAVHARFHTERKILPDGKERWGDPVMCEEDETCNLCTTQGEPSRPLMLAWVWVYYIDHAENRQQTGRFGGDPWQPVAGADGRPLFREIIEAPRVIKATSRLINQVMTVFGHEGSLLAKDYTMTRIGARKSSETTYSLYPQKEANFERDLTKCNLVSLIDFAEGRATLGGEEVQQYATATKSVEEGDLVSVGGIGSGRPDVRPTEPPVEFGADDAGEEAEEGEDSDFGLSGEDSEDQ